MRIFIIVLFSFLFSLSAFAEVDRNSDHAKKTLEIFRTIIEIDSSKTTGGGTPIIANYLKGELLAAGFTEDDIEIVRADDLAGLIVKYKARPGSTKKPILLLGHMDVVEANPSDWERAPFTLEEDDTYFYGRGTTDNKFGVAQLTGTFIKLKKEGFEPDRELILVFTGDEESGMITTRIMAYERPDLAKAEYALNSDAGGGHLDDDGNAVVFSVQAAEKTYATWHITVRNQGGHSSRPRADNALYDVADAIKAIQGHSFPVMSTEITRNYFKESGEMLGGEVGQAMVDFAENPDNKMASDRLQKESSYVGFTRTTCIPTMIHGGHAENAQPQSVVLTVNCRIFPGVAIDDIEVKLGEVIGNDALEFNLLQRYPESPVSETRPDVMAAVRKAVDLQYRDVKMVTYMESGGTDGMHFRMAGVPTWSVPGRFMNPDDMFAHGLNERVPIKGFYDALDHWSIVIKELTSGEPIS